MTDSKEALRKTGHPSKRVGEDVDAEGKRPIGVEVASYTVPTKGKAEGEKGEAAYVVCEGALYLSLPQEKGEKFHAHFDASVRAISRKLGLDLHGPYVAWPGGVKPVKFIGIKRDPEEESTLRVYKLTVGNTWGVPLGPYCTAIGVAGWTPTTETPAVVANAFKTHLIPPQTGKQSSKV